MPETPPECIQCGDCCRWSGFVYLNEDDIRLAARFLNMEESAFIQKYAVLGPNRHQLCLIPGAGRDCVFLCGNNCRIYPARPQQCRDFPLRWGTCPHRQA